MCDILYRSFRNNETAGAGTAVKDICKADQLFVAT